MWRKLRKLAMTLTLLGLLAAIFILALPREDLVLKRVGIDRELGVERGLDLQGGVYLVYEADVVNLAAVEAKRAVDNVATVLKRRADPAGTSEVIVQTANNNQVVVQYPGVQNTEALMARLGRTARLIFLELNVPSDGELPVPIETGITGKDLERASVNVDPQTNRVAINFKMKGGESTDKFAELTTRLNKTAGRLMVQLDDEIIVNPAGVNSPILNGEASLTGQFTFKEAQTISDLLNAGALPVPVKLVAQRSIGPSLGELSIKQSVVAAAIGLITVAMFLVLYYRLNGVAALASLVFYSSTTMTLYKLSTLTPYTIVLSLAGIAGFILSIAVVADSNILVLERVKEESRRGAPTRAAMTTGYNRAWASIRDANLATLIGSAILFQFGTPIIKGFAVTLSLGIILNLIILRLLTKPMLRRLGKWHIVSGHPSWFGLKPQKEDL